jgi:hypothetical protein
MWEAGGKWGSHIFPMFDHRDRRLMLASHCWVVVVVVV